MTDDQLHDVLLAMAEELEGTSDGTMANYIAAYHWHENFRNAAEKFLKERTEGLEQKK